MVVGCLSAAGIESCWPLGRVKALSEPEGADFQRITNPKTRALEQNKKNKRNAYIALVVILTLTGTLLSCLYRGIQEAVTLISFSRANLLTDMFNEGKVFEGWLYFFLTGALLVIAATLLVLWQPQAAGSGLPELISYMNGVKSDGLLHWRTMVAKGLGLILAVSAGLAIGPEGPTIHLGALIAVQLVHVLWAMFHRNAMASQALGHFFNDLMVRNIVVAGAAAGIATAFRAPIGGVTFAIEEVVSDLDSNLIFRTYFTCIVAYYILEVLYHGGTLNTAGFTAFSVQTDCNVGYQAQDIFFFAMLGAVGGLGGSLFNYLNIKIRKWRAKHINSMGYKRLLEGVVVIFVTTTLLAFIPLGFKCVPATQLVRHVPSVYTGVAHLTDYDVIIEENDVCLSREAFRHFGDATGNGTFDELFELLELKQLNCPSNHYHEMATLMHNPSHAVVSVLFETGTYDIVSAGSIALYLAIYFALAVYTVGISVSSGLVIPMLTIGACIGRLFGVGINHIIKLPLDLPTVDPGAWAMVGAASFWAGSGGMVVTIAVIILEMTGDFSHLPPIAVGVLTARAIGSIFDHGLYHMIIHLKHIPFLDGIPPSATLNMTSADVMRHPVVSLALKSKVKDILDALKTTHNGFPVVANEAPHKLKGLVLRKDILTVLPCSPNATQTNLRNMTVCFSEVMNEAPATALTSAPLDDSYRLFRTLGLRHLVVVDTEHTVHGIITRKDLDHVQGALHQRQRGRIAPWGSDGAEGRADGNERPRGIVNNAYSETEDSSDGSHQQNLEAAARHEDLFFEGTFAETGLNGSDTNHRTSNEANAAHQSRKTWERFEDTQHEERFPGSADNDDASSLDTGYLEITADDSESA